MARASERVTSAARPMMVSASTVASARSGVRMSFIRLSGLKVVNERMLHLAKTRLLDFGPIAASFEQLQAWTRKKCPITRQGRRQLAELDAKFTDHRFNQRRVHFRRGVVGFATAGPAAAASSAR